MLVVEHLRADEVLEETSLGTSALQVLEVGVEVERAQGIAPVLVRGHRRKQEPQGVGETCVRSLTLLELEVMDRGVHLGCVNAVIGKPFKGFEHHALHLFCVLDRDSLQAGAEDRFTKVVVQPAAVGQRAAQPRVDERLAQRGACIAEQDLREEVHP